MEIFQKELDARERAAVSTTSTFQGKKPVKDVPTASSLLTGDSTINCCFCGQSHTSEVSTLIHYTSVSALTCWSHECVGQYAPLAESCRRMHIGVLGKSAKV